MLFGSDQRVGDPHGHWKAGPPAITPSYKQHGNSGSTPKAGPATVIDNTPTRGFPSTAARTVSIIPGKNTTDLAACCGRLRWSSRAGIIWQTAPPAAYRNSPSRRSSVTILWFVKPNKFSCVAGAAQRQLSFQALKVLVSEEGSRNSPIKGRRWVGASCQQGECTPRIGGESHVASLSWK